ncbi:MAG: aminopeptidase N [Desulfuromonadales bacterium]|nr:aminopeptidase N [Desulfuromonadales bacterium]
MSADLQPIRLQDYRPPAYLVDQVDLRFELLPTRTLVHSRLQLRANPAVAAPPGPLRLDGRQLELLAVRLDGHPLAAADYRLDDEGLTIPRVPCQFVLETEVAIDPQGNSALEGLYRASGLYCTQCEAQGFRKITFYPDRPDVMARFTTTLIADRESCPVLLSNGNCVEAGDAGDGRHFATFVDPFPKPSYLFALVAGALSAVEDRFVTASGRDVRLQIFVEPRNLDQCAHAMGSLQQAMAWDERVYGLECDLDEYKIVAVDDFNMGAMENKGLNVFNSKYVLARPETATDADFQAIEAVVAHEYFHNWTGNRVTCRDWFQLSLKEGLTVFRDQEFSADMGSRAVKRIADVRLLRNVQFPEDSGPMAHPVRPESYVEINNFYTATVYNKGAEVIRMYRTLLGDEGFQCGVRLYLERHDGQAVTTDDFLAAMAAANDVDLEPFRLWYRQAGTPHLDVRGEYDESAREFRLHVRQSCAATPGQPVKEPFLVPLTVGLLGPDGRDLPLQLAGETAASATQRTLQVTAREQTFDFINLDVAPVPSLLRGFSAPVRLNYPYSSSELAFLFAHDSDPFNRWDAGQRLAAEVLLEMAADRHDGWQPAVPEYFVAAFAAVLADQTADPALRALALTLPGEVELAEMMTPADPSALHLARQRARHTLAERLEPALREVFAAMAEAGPYLLDAAAIGRRSLKNACLTSLALLENAEVDELCFEQFVAADNMTDRLAALGCFAHSGLPRREEVLDAFYHRYQDEPLVIDKWLTLQATSPLPGALQRVVELMEHPAFTLRNPNRVRALLGAFAQGNPYHFHQPSGAGYRFVADQILALDPLNPQTAARLVAPLSRWRRYDEQRQALMRGELERLHAAPQLSRDVGEIVAKSLE